MKGVWVEPRRETWAPEGQPLPEQSDHTPSSMPTVTLYSPPTAQLPNAVTWQVDVSRQAGLAMAARLRAAILQDVLDGWHSAPCRAQSRSEAHRQKAATVPSQEPQKPVFPP